MIYKGISFGCCRSSLNDDETSKSRDIQLLFDDVFPSSLFTGSKLSMENRPIKVLLYDASSNQRITSGPLSSAKVDVVVLNGEFNPSNLEDWSEEEFSKMVIRAREGKRPLLTGDLIIQLRDGVGYLGDLSFTDNSSWIKSRTFRLGVKLNNRSGEFRVREGVSKPFTVRDHRGEGKFFLPALISINLLITPCKAEEEDSLFRFAILSTSTFLMRISISILLRCCS